MTVTSVEMEEPDAFPVLAGLVVVIFAIPSMLVFRPLGAGATPGALLGMILCLWWVGSRQLRTSQSTTVRPLHWALALFAISILLSYSFAHFRGPSPLEMRSADRGLLMLIAWTGFALTVADGILSRRNLDRFLRTIVAAAAAMAVVGLLQFFVGFELARYAVFPGLSPRSDLGLIQERSLFRRVTGTTTHPLEFGVVLAMVLPLAIHFVVASAYRRRRHIVYLIIIAATIPMSVSRSATLATGVALLLLFAGWSRSQRRKALLLIPAFAIALRLLIPGLLGTIKSLFTNASRDPSIAGRTEDYANVAHYFTQSPVLGRGWGTFVPELYPLLDNQYLGQVLETGLVGLAALLTLFLVGIFCARGARRRSTDSETRHLGQALTAAIAVPTATFATFDGLGFSMVTALTFLLLGSSACLWRLTVEEHGFAIDGRWSKDARNDPPELHESSRAVTP